MPGNFIDTNLLVYLAQADAGKAERVEALLREDAVISVQVLNEFANVALRKLAFCHQEIRHFLDLVRLLARVHPIDPRDHDAALILSERYRLSVHDSVIVASALGHGCTLLWSQDMHHGLLIDDRLLIQNPFIVPA
jgi:predicted nucleic acid-binding protein